MVKRTMGHLVGVGVATMCMVATLLVSAQPASAYVGCRVKAELLQGQAKVSADGAAMCDMPGSFTVNVTVALQGYGITETSTYRACTYSGGGFKDCAGTRATIATKTRDVWCSRVTISWKLGKDPWQYAAASTGHRCR